MNFQCFDAERRDRARQESRDHGRDPAVEAAGPVLRQYEQSGEMKGYRQEPEVAPESQTETYAVARVFVEN